MAGERATTRVLRRDELPLLFKGRLLVTLAQLGILLLTLIAHIVEIVVLRPGLASLRALGIDEGARFTLYDIPVQRQHLVVLRWTDLYIDAAKVSLGLLMRLRLLMGLQLLDYAYSVGIRDLRALSLRPIVLRINPIRLVFGLIAICRDVMVRAAGVGLIGQPRQPAVDVLAHKAAELRRRQVEAVDSVQTAILRSFCHGLSRV